MEAEQMKIQNIRSEQKNNSTRFAATVNWEDCDRADQEIYFEIEEEFAKDLKCNPHSFLVACIMPAMRHGERRVFIDSVICPELRKNLITAMRLVCHWYTRYDVKRNIVLIEAKEMSDGRSIRAEEREAFFFSGGMDSMATLRANRLNFPLEHPASFKDGLIVHGLQAEIDEAFERIKSSLSVIAQEAGITLVQVSTNIRYLYDDWGFWTDEFEAAVFSAVAHALKPRITSATIAPTYDYPNLHPHGSSPLLDPNFSSRDLRIRHDDVTISRLEKTKLVADWDVALQHIRVCNNPEPPDNLNCGKCEKCVRTMLALLALGVIDKAGDALPIKNVSEDLIRSGVRMNKTTSPFYPELIAPLLERGRHDLVRAIEKKIADYNKPKWKGMFRRTIAEFDKIYLNSRLKKMKN